MRLEDDYSGILLLLLSLLSGLQARHDETKREYTPEAGRY